MTLCRAPSLWRAFILILLIVNIAIVHASDGHPKSIPTAELAKSPPQRVAITIKTDLSPDWHPDKYKETLPQFLANSIGAAYTSANPPPLPRQPGPLHPGPMFGAGVDKRTLMSDWRALSSVCFSSQVDLFQYTVCPFRNATQRQVATDQVVLLGVFEDWFLSPENHLGLTYTDGSICSGTVCDASSAPSPSSTSPSTGIGHNIDMGKCTSNNERKRIITVSFSCATEEPHMTTATSTTTTTDTATTTLIDASSPATTANVNQDAITGMLDQNSESVENPENQVSGIGMSIPDVLRVYTTLTEVVEIDTCRYTASLILPNVAAVCDIHGINRKKWTARNNEFSDSQEMTGIVIPNDAMSSSSSLEVQKQKKAIPLLESITSASLHAYMSGQRLQPGDVDEEYTYIHHNNKKDLNAEIDEPESDSKDVKKWMWQSSPKNEDICLKQHAVLSSEISTLHGCFTWLLARATNGRPLPLNDLPAKCLDFVEWLSEEEDTGNDDVIEDAKEDEDGDNETNTSDNVDMNIHHPQKTPDSDSNEKINSMGRNVWKPIVEEEGESLFPVPMAATVTSTGDVKFLSSLTGIVTEETAQGDSDPHPGVERAEELGGG